MSPPQIIFVVDDDESVLRSLRRLFLAEGYQVETFEDPRSFLSQHDAERAACVIVDLRMPGLSGLELQEALAERGWLLPAVFITGYGDVPSCVTAMKGGAIDFLCKPYDEDELLAAVREAIARGRELRRQRDERVAAEARWAALTGREMEVARLIAAGLLSKQVASELGMAERTVAAHRGQVMRKLEVGSVADLVRLLDRLQDSRSDSVRRPD